MKLSSTALVSALMLLMFLPLRADIVPVGDGLPTGSWQQRFEESGVGQFDKIEVFMLTSGISFSSGGGTDFSNASWTATTPNSRYVLATGPATSSLQFNLHFSPSNQSTPFLFDFLAWDPDGTLAEAAHASWNSKWNFTVFSPSAAALASYDRLPPTILASSVVVPEPSAYVVLLAGLAGVYYSVRRRRPRR